MSDAARMNGNLLGTKKCSGCRRELSLDIFHVDESRRHLDGRQNRCHECMRDYNRFRRYGITREQYEHLLDVQGHACAGCKRPYEVLPPTKGRTERLYVDHDHSTGMVRGLLCFECNGALGLVRDEPDVLANLELYLIHPPGTDAFWPEPAVSK